MIERWERAQKGPSALSDRDLIARTLDGDREAFGILVQRYRTLVIGVAYRICGNTVVAEDIAQETFVRVWTKLSTFRPEGNFKGWLCRIAANLTIDALRKQKPILDVEHVVLTSPNMGPESTVLKEERAAAVRAAIMRLPLQSRTVLTLREYQRLSYREIADVLEIPLGTVKSRLSDARRRLKTELVPYLTS